MWKNNKKTITFERYVLNLFSFAVKATLRKTARWENVKNSISLLFGGYTICFFCKLILVIVFEREKKMACYRQC